MSIPVVSVTVVPHLAFHEEHSRHLSPVTATPGIVVVVTTVASVVVAGTQLVHLKYLFIN